uniref:Serpin domain-containing protein n=1 Tax=Chrysolophus pictus TaxID=9089 RepID=A0A8C3LFT3_CHRPC
MQTRQAMPCHSLLCFLFTGQIKNLLVSSSIDFGTMMVFINTIYFKGIWKTAFNTEDTQEMPFRMTKVGTRAPQLEKFKKNCPLLTLSRASVLQQESKPVQMMCLNDTFNVAMLPAEKMKILELPYTSGLLSMLVLLPDEVSGLERIEKTINFEKLREWTSTNAMEKKSMKVYLPRMKIEEKYNLTSILMALGMTDLFSRSANLTGISSVDNLMISDAVHGAFMEVNEEGTEAAGSTGAIGNIKHSLELEEFRADHPFLFFIRFNPTNVILLFGRCRSP